MRDQDQMGKSTTWTEFLPKSARSAGLIGWAFLVVMTGLCLTSHLHYHNVDDIDAL